MKIDTGRSEQHTTRIINRMRRNVAQLATTSVQLTVLQPEVHAEYYQRMRGLAISIATDLGELLNRAQHAAAEEQMPKKKQPRRKK